MPFYYTENSIIGTEDPVYDEMFDPYVDDPSNPRAVKLPQTLGCMTWVCALVAAATILGCNALLGKSDDKKEKAKPQEQPEQQETKETPKKVASFLQSTTFTYSQALREHGE